MAKYKVVATDDRFGEKYDEYELAILEAVGAEVTIYKEGELTTEEDFIEACRDADGILLNLANFKSESLIASLPNCKVINRYGVGYDNVNVPACTKAGIQVTYVPDYCMEDVSDHALALIFACLRQVPMRDRKIREGQWSIPGGGMPRRIKGKSLGLVGTGRIARTLAKKVSGFGLDHVYGYDPYLDADTMAEYGIEKVDLETLLKNSDFVSLHMPVTDETRGMINKETLSLMKENAILINTGRGPLVNDADLLEALKNHKIGAAGLDTHCVEPLAEDSPYKELDNVVLTDHTAYGTEEGSEELRTKSARNIAKILTGEPLADIYKVNRL